MFLLLTNRQHRNYTLFPYTTLFRSQLSNQQIKKFQQKILSWYEENKRDLPWRKTRDPYRSEEHTSELQSRLHLVCRLLLEKKKTIRHYVRPHVTKPANNETSH